jgi:hypothetical protein
MNSEAETELGRAQIISTTQTVPNYISGDELYILIIENDIVFARSWWPVDQRSKREDHRGSNNSTRPNVNFLGQVCLLCLCWLLEGGRKGASLLGHCGTRESKAGAHLGGPVAIFQK